MSKEIWKDIEGYEGLYQVSNHGKVKSLARKIIWDKGSREVKDKLLSNKTKNTSGYLQVSLSKDGKSKIVTIHRLVAKHFLKDFNKNLTINHKDGNKLNNNIENLECISNVDNLRHAHENNLIIIKKGLESPNCKFSKLEIVEILNLLNSGVFQSEIAKKYNVHQTTISKIKNNKEKYL